MIQKGEVITTLKRYVGDYAVIRKTENGYWILQSGFGCREDAARVGRIIAVQENLEFKEKPE